MDVPQCERGSRESDSVPLFAAGTGSIHRTAAEIKAALPKPSMCRSYIPVTDVVSKVFAKGSPNAWWRPIDHDTVKTHCSIRMDDAVGRPNLLELGRKIIQKNTFHHVSLAVPSVMLEAGLTPIASNLAVFLDIPGPIHGGCTGITGIIDLLCVADEPACRHLCVLDVKSVRSFYRCDPERPGFHLFAKLNSFIQTSLYAHMLDTAMISSGLKWRVGTLAIVGVDPFHGFVHCFTVDVDDYSLLKSDFDGTRNRLWNYLVNERAGEKKK